MHMTATLSPCRTYRYDLTRRWGEGPLCAFIGLNPSTADETTDDPTIRRCIGFARDWGCGQLVMLNAYAYRATNPRDMKRSADPIGPNNDAALRWWSGKASVVVAAWGTHCDPSRAQAIRAMIPELHYLRLTKHGQPSHPLYLPRALTPQPWPHDA
jgi:hypothetical protein